MSRTLESMFPTGVRYSKDQSVKNSEMFSTATFSRVMGFVKAHGEGDEVFSNIIDEMLRISKKTGFSNSEDKKDQFTEKLLALFFCEHENNADYASIDQLLRSCPEQDRCDHYMGTVNAIDTVIQLFYSVGFVEKKELSAQMYRFLELFADDPVNVHMILGIFDDTYEIAGAEREKIVPHLKSLCDLYEGYPADERYMLNGELLMSLSAP